MLRLSKGLGNFETDQGQENSSTSFGPDRELSLFWGQLSLPDTVSEVDKVFPKF